jgi:hypothetical protein
MLDPTIQRIIAGDLLALSCSNGVPIELIAYLLYEMYPASLRPLWPEFDGDEAVMLESDRGAEYATRPQLNALRYAMQRDAGGRAVSVGGDREPDKHKQPDTLPDLPRKPQIQAAAAEIIEYAILSERLIVDVDAPNRSWKGRLDTWRGPALLAGVGGQCAAVGASIGVLAPHSSSTYSCAHFQGWRYHTQDAWQAHRRKQ